MSQIFNWQSDPNAAPVVNALANHGYNNAAIAGVMANLYNEGVFIGGANHGYLNPGTYIADHHADGSYAGMGGGIAGWLGPRHEALQSFAYNNGFSSWQDINAQAAYLVHELTTGYSGVNNTLLNVSNDANGAAAAASAFTIGFERPAHMYQRAAERAEDAAAAFNQGLFNGTGANGGLGGNNSATGVSTGAEPSGGAGITPSQSPTRASRPGTVGGGSGGRGFSGLSTGKDPYAAQLKQAVGIADIRQKVDKTCSLINLRSMKGFYFYFNESVSVEFPVNYSSPGNVLGRSVPVTGYESTGAKSVSVSLPLYAGLMYGPDADDRKDPCGKLYEDLDFLTSLEYPDYSTALVIPPPIVFLSINEGIKVRGVLKNLRFEHHRPLDRKGRSMHVDVSFTVVQVSENPPDDRAILRRSLNSF